MGNVWLHRYSVLVLVCTFLLVIAGGLVTSNEAALAIPDWPLSYGKLVPPLEGGIRFEFAHRMLAATVGLLTLILACWIQASEQRVWLRRLGWLAVGTVVSQALLGGAAVTFVDPKPIAIAHACLAQICFGMLVAVVVLSRTDDRFLSSVSPRSGQASADLVGEALSQESTSQSAEPALSRLTDDTKRSSVLLAAMALFIQTALGAAVRHNVISAIPHMVGAGISTALVMRAGLGILIHHMEDTLLRRYATLLLSLTFLQVFLGLAAYMSRIAAVDDPQPMPMTIGFTVAHVAAGSLTFGAAVALALIVYRDARPATAVLAHGGMAVA